MKPSSDDSDALTSGPLRPADHIDGDGQLEGGKGGPTQPKLGPVGWLRFVWRQLTAMRTAIILLLMLALAAIPGSVFPQQSSDPNGVIQLRADNPDLVWLYDALSLNHVYSSPWFSAIYILLFVSLIGCIIPRIRHHWQALRTQPPKTPARMQRLTGFQLVPGSEDDIERADAVLKKLGYRTRRFGASVSAERGYLRETGNLLFHISLVGVLLSVAIGSGWGYSGQRLVVEGQSYANTLSSMDTWNPGRWVSESALPSYSLKLDKLDVVYEQENMHAYGQPIDFTASVTVSEPDGEGGTTSRDAQIKVNEPLRVQGADLYLLSNGYAPTVTVRNPAGDIVYQEAWPFLAQDNQMTSLGVIKIPDGLAEQVGLRGFFYPTAVELDTGALASAYPDLANPVVSFQVFAGDLGLDGGVPQSVYELDTDDMEQVAGGESDTEAVTLALGESSELPNGLGTISFDDVDRYAVIDIHHDPTQLWVLGWAILLVASLLVSLFIPRRRVWVKATAKGLEVAGLARGEDPGLSRAVDDIAKRVAGTAAASEDAPASTKDAPPASPSPNEPNEPHEPNEPKVESSRDD